MSWAFGNATAIQTGTQTTAFGVNYPSAPAAGNTIFLAVSCWQAGRTVTVGDLGFNLLGSLLTGNGTLGLYAKVASGAESGTFNVTTNTANPVFYQTALFTGGPADQTSFNAAVITPQTVSGSSGLNLPYAALALGGVPNALVFALGEKLANGSVIAQPSAFPNRLGTTHSASGPSCFVWDYAIQTVSADITAGNWSITTGDVSAARQSIVAAIGLAGTFPPLPGIPLIDQRNNPLLRM